MRTVVAVVNNLYFWLVLLGLNLGAWAGHVFFGEPGSAWFNVLGAAICLLNIRNIITKK